MLILTTPQREMLLWAYKRRNSFKFADVVQGVHGAQPKRTDMIQKTLDSLVKGKLVLSDYAPATSGPVGTDANYTLTDFGRDIAGNIVAAIKAGTKLAA